MPIEALLAGLISSLITIVATKLLEIFQKSREHKYSLKRALFEKKLQSAEAAVMEWHSIASSCSALAGIYEQLSAKDTEIEGDVAVQLTEVFYERIQKAHSIANQLSDTVFLYFDIDDSPFYESESLNKLVLVFTKLSALSESFEILKKLKEQTKHPVTEKAIQAQMERIQDEAIIQARDLSMIFDKAYKEMVKLIRKLRADLRRFDS
jgi:hypothetical protein